MNGENWVNKVIGSNGVYWVMGAHWKGDKKDKECTTNKGRRQGYMYKFSLQSTFLSGRKTMIF